jgi:protein ImuB
MRRVVSLYLPTWPTDRIRRRTGEPPRHEPLVTVHAVGSRRVVRAACAAAQEAGLHVGMALAQAQALVPNLHVVYATPDEDEASLRDLARWAIAYSPMVAPNPPDGLWIDIAGVAHLFGSEEELLADLTSRLMRQGIAAKAAVADVPGAAWAVARYGAGGIVPTGRTVDAVAALSIRALRIAADKLSALHRLGLERIGQLAAMPRAPLVRRFGRDVALRLDQALGHAFEPITPYMGRYVSQVLIADGAVTSEVEPDGAHANRSSASPYIRLGHSPDHDPACDGNGLQGERDHSFLRRCFSQGVKAVALPSDITRYRSSASA